MPEERPTLVAVAGACGRMGREVVRAVHEAEGMELVAAVDHSEIGRPIDEVIGIDPIGPTRPIVQNDLAAALDQSGAQVLVDFTVPASAMANIRVALEAGVAPVVGTTGLTQEDIAEVRTLCEESGVGALIAPNFAIGAVLMMQFAEQAARYLPDVEIVELHHEKKLDSPSGTAVMTAQKIAAARAGSPVRTPDGTVEKIPGGRGAVLGDVHIHSVRLPGHVAHQMVVFGGLGETLTIRHDSLDRKGFMPGVILAIRKVQELEGLVVGLENLL
jgi:4-hydroxy-tetrahydrodipicolinate reductase